MWNRRIIATASWVFICCLCACAGTRTGVVPTPNEVKYTVGKKCPAATYSGRTTITTPGHALDVSATQIGTDFLAVMSNAGVFERLVAVKEGQPQGELNLVGTFVANYDPKRGDMLGKAILTGCFLLLPAPFIWYDENIDVTGTVDVFEGGAKVREMKAEAKAVLSYQFLSERRRYGLQSEAIAQARTSAYRQLLAQLAAYCTNR